MTEPAWQWSTLSRAEVRDHGRAVVAAAIEREGFAAERSGGLIAAAHGAIRFEAHVRTLRSLTYTYWSKKQLQLAPSVYAAFVLLADGRPPAAFLIPSLTWKEGGALLVSRDYVGLASDPEWGLNLSGKTLPLLEEFALAKTLRSLARA